MSRKLLILIACTALSCTPTRSYLTYKQAQALEQLFNDFAARHQLMNRCYPSSEIQGAREIINLEWLDTTDIVLAEPPRWIIDHNCIILSLNSDSVYRSVGLIKYYDRINTVDQWIFFAVAQYDGERCDVYRLDTVFAQDVDVRSFYDSIPSYIEQAYRWTSKKRKSELPLCRSYNRNL